MRTLPVSEAFLLPLRMILFLIWATVAVGNLVNRKAAAPATCGVAIEVPLRKAYDVALKPFVRHFTATSST